MAEFEPVPHPKGKCMGRHDKCTQRAFCALESQCYDLAVYHEECNKVEPPELTEEEKVESAIVDALDNLINTIKEESNRLTEAIWSASSKIRR
jgi:hypothetical protein